jgi:ribonuclease H2 subunit A
MSALKRRRSEIEFDVDDFKRAYPEADDDTLILGIDEAGRGPAIGPMVYTGALVALRDHNRLVYDCEVADSKVLNEAARNGSLSKLEALPSFQSITIPVSAGTIAEAMTGRHGKNLNTLSHDTAIELIHKAVLLGKGKLLAVFVDTVGIPEAYQRKLSGRFPHLRITVSKKADAKFPIVSAASIVAKTTRDAAIASLGIKCGTGYPSDPLTMQWLDSHVHRFFVYGIDHSYVRMSWGPVVQICKQQCIGVVFEQDLENMKVDTKQSTLSFTKAAPRRDPMLAHFFGLRYTTRL